MKIFLMTASLLISTFVFSQVAVGKATITAGSNVSLEFYSEADNARGIILPWVSTVAGNPVAYDASTGAGYKGIGTVVDGTIIFDLSDKKVKYRKAGSWEPLTGSVPMNVNGTTINAFNAVDSSLQDSKKEQENAKVAIGTNASSDTTPGILVLTDSNKAMVLPKVASPHLTIQNPAPGMMAYDTVKKQLAVYNGTVWSFWKP